MILDVAIQFKPTPPSNLKMCSQSKLLLYLFLEQVNSSALLSFDPHSWSQPLSSFRFTFLA